MKPHKKQPVDVLKQALPAPNPLWSGISAKTYSGHNALKAGKAPTASEVSKAKSELFGRLKPRQLFKMLGLDSLGSVLEDGGESILSSSLTARSEPIVSSLSASASTSPAKGVAPGAALPEVLVLDIRPPEAAEGFQAVRLVGAQHVPFSQYMTQDRLPPAMHVARRQVPQPVIVLYDDCTGRAMDGPDFAGKLIQAGRFDAVMILEGGLRSCAMEEPRLLEGSRALDYVSGVQTEVRRQQGGHGIRSARGGGGGGGGGGDGTSPTKSSSGETERGSQVSQASARTARTGGTFGGSKRF
jgi:hypothetical protein